MKKIVQWVEKEGVDGYLYFEGKELRITHSDPKEEKRQVEEKKEDKKRQRTASLESSEKKFEKKKESKKAVPMNCK